MAPGVFFGRGVSAELPALLRGVGSRRTLVVTGRASYETGVARQQVEAAVADTSWRRFCDFDVNPKLRAVERGLDLMRGEAFDTVIGVGGGSVLDMAKLLAVLAAQEAPPLQYIERTRELTPRHNTLVLVPTTAGTGSEVTPFAVVYVEDRKHSLDDPLLQADFCLIDPALTEGMPAALTASCGLDALSQAVESYWSVRSTAASRQYAAEAIDIIVEMLEEACLAPTPRSRELMCRASLLAGRAISLTRTTAPHAVSYPLTARFAIPHGHACGLVLGPFVGFNGAISNADAADPRGADFVRARIEEIVSRLGAGSVQQARERVQDLMRRIGLETRLAPLGVTPAAFGAVAEAAVGSQRLVNNPRRVRREDVEALLMQIA